MNDEAAKGDKEGNQKHPSLLHLGVRDLLVLNTELEMGQIFGIRVEGEEEQERHPHLPRSSCHYCEMILPASEFRQSDSFMSAPGWTGNEISSSVGLVP